MLAFEFKKKDKQFFSVPLMPFYVIQIKIYIKKWKYT